MQGGAAGAVHKGSPLLVLMPCLKRCFPDGTKLRPVVAFEGRTFDR